jgi:hypothetical protein
MRCGCMPLAFAIIARFFATRHPASIQTSKPNA